MSADLDRRVAEIVGYKYDHAGDLIEFSKYVEDAIAALEAMAERDWLWAIHRLSGFGYDVDLQPIEIGAKVCSGRDKHSLPLAICRAICATEEKP